LRQRDRNSVRQLTGGSLPSNCGSAFASALPIRDGGLTPAALVLHTGVFAGEIATFAIHERMPTAVGGQPIRQRGNHEQGWLGNGR